ncbi:MAG: HNH endonuclease [Candidatus Hydrogenedentes bacterium]|nr:HNH endonuclease [Candidatus Hydrogenedentota bacterium]
MDWRVLLSEIEDSLFPRLRLSVWERVVYYHLLRQTWVREEEKTLCSVAGISSRLVMSDVKVREVLRSLQEKGCIKIEERTRLGHEIRVLLPSELNLTPDAEDPIPDLSTIDFFSGRHHVESLLKRENGRCFYCLREVSKERCELDHVNPQVDGGDNSYRNVVISCHECNKVKQDLTGEEHLRRLYRKGLLSEPEFQERTAALNALRSGELVPQL